MIPARLCGAWILLSSPNYECIGARLYLDYNKVTYTQYQRVSFATLSKTKYAVIHGTTRVVWSNKVFYELQSDVLPRFIVPAFEKTPRMTVTYDADDLFLTVYTPVKHIFRRDTLRPPQDNLFKIFLTQLVFDFIIRHLYPTNSI